MHRNDNTKSGAFINPQALMAIKNLEVRARIVVEGFWNGLHRSPYHGFSVEFTEYRDYTPGDDLRYLDWKLYARTDRYYIKKFEDETNLRCHLIVDNSQSMTFGSGGFSKASYANTLAATLAYFLNSQGDATGLLTFDEDIRDYLPARHRPGHLRLLMLALEKPAGGHSTDLTAPLKRIVEVIKKRGLLIVISDLFAPVDALERGLSNLRAAGHDVIVFQVMDPAEVSLDFQNASMFRDVESGRTLYIDPSVARAEYKLRLGQHLESVEKSCSKLGIVCMRLTTDRPLELALFDFLRARMQRNKHSRAIMRQAATAA